MNSRAGNSTALKRLMTEYKQLTAGGMILDAWLIIIGGFIDVDLNTLQDLQMECLQLVCPNHANLYPDGHQLILPQSHDSQVQYRNPTSLHGKH